jgi:transposase-like protein
MSIVAQGAESGKGLALAQKRQAHQRELQDRIRSTIRSVVAGVFNEALEDEATRFLGRAKGRHRSGLQAQPTNLQCSACGRHRTLDFVRKGHYERTQLTLWGAVDLAIPRMECVCGHCPFFPCQTLTPYDRLWSDLDEETLALVALDVSLRSIGEVVHLQSGDTVSIGTAQRRVRRMAAVAAWHLQQKLTVSPPVIMVDAIFGSLMVDTGEKKRDKKGRLRRVKHGVKRPLLIAQSIDPVTGKTELLAWAEGEAEDVDAWVRLLTMLHDRGIHATSGLRLLIHDGSGSLEAALAMVDFGPVRQQRCVFHKLRNVLRDLTRAPGLSREKQQEHRQAVLADAHAIYEAATAEQARARAAQFRARWQADEPKAVATLERDFAATLTYYALCEEAASQGQAWKTEHLRTTSPLEGMNRSLRAKWRQACAFPSSDGRAGAFWLVVRRRERPDKNDRSGWLDGVMADFSAPH